MDTHKATLADLHEAYGLVRRGKSRAIEALGDDIAGDVHTLVEVLGAWARRGYAEPGEVAVGPWAAAHGRVRARVDAIAPESRDGSRPLTEAEKLWTHAAGWLFHAERGRAVALVQPKTDEAPAPPPTITERMYRILREIKMAAPAELMRSNIPGRVTCGGTEAKEAIDEMVESGFIEDRGHGRGLRITPAGLEIMQIYADRTKVVEPA